MAIEIFSVSSCVNINKKWQLVTNYFDLKNKREPLKKLRPLPEIPRLPIGAGIDEKDKTITKRSGESKHIIFSNFSDGKIISIEELSERLYSFDVSKEVLIDTKLYMIHNGGPKPYVFFCYELFRTFLSFDNKLIPYLFQFDVLESFIDESVIREKGNKRILYLDFNNSFPKSLLRNKKFLRNYIYVLYNNSIREYWKSIQANSTISKSDFSFNSIDLGELDLVCRVKEYNDFTLIYDIEEIKSKLEFPFDELEHVHPSFIDKNRKKQSNGERKKGSFPVKMPTSHSTDDDENESDSSEYSEDISVLPLHIEFDKTMVFTRIYNSSDDDSSSSGKGSKISLPKLQLEDSKVGFNNNEKDGKGESISLNLTRDEGFNKFDYSEIPEGLVFFTKAFGLLASNLKLNYTYKIKQFTNNSSFSKIGDNIRKALIVIIQHKQNPIFYIVEVDSSDERFISTLILTNLDVKDKDTFFENVLIKAGEKNGVWPEEYISMYCDYRTVRHPKMTKQLKRKPEAKRNDIYIEKLALKILKILVR